MKPSACASGPAARTHSPQQVALRRRVGRLVVGEGDLFLQAQPTGDRETLGKADLELPLPHAGIVIEAGFKFRVGQAAGLVHPAERLADAQAGRREVGILGADAVADARKRHDHAGLRPEG